VAARLSAQAPQTLPGRDVTRLSHPPWQTFACGIRLPNSSQNTAPIWPLPGLLFDAEQVPRKRPELILIAQRVAAARKIVADQQALIADLTASGQSAADAEKTLQTYLSSLRHLEDHARKLRAKGR
jgi:hypothetical protein